MSAIIDHADRACAQYRLNQLCELLERIAERCGWDKIEDQCTESERLHRDRYRQYLKEAGELESALGA